MSRYCLFSRCSVCTQYTPSRFFSNAYNVYSLLLYMLFSCIITNIFFFLMFKIALLKIDKQHYKNIEYFASFVDVSHSVEYIKAVQSEKAIIIFSYIFLRYCGVFQTFFYTLNLIHNRWFYKIK